VTVSPFVDSAENWDSSTLRSSVPPAYSGGTPSPGVSSVGSSMFALNDVSRLPGWLTVADEEEPRRPVQPARAASDVVPAARNVRRFIPLYWGDCLKDCR